MLEEWGVIWDIKPIRVEGGENSLCRSVCLALQAILAVYAKCVSPLFLAQKEKQLLANDSL